MLVGLEVFHCNVIIALIARDHHLHSPLLPLKHRNIVGDPFFDPTVNGSTVRANLVPYSLIFLRLIPSLLRLTSYRGPAKSWNIGHYWRYKWGCEVVARLFFMQSEGLVYGDLISFSLFTAVFYHLLWIFNARINKLRPIRLKSTWFCRWSEPEVRNGRGTKCSKK